jgi:DNA-binding GntR family transcriptional regulator
MARRKGPQADQAYRYVLDKILSFGILPGQTISDSAISVELGMSREPVREAFMRLEADGLIERAASCVKCAELSLDDIKEICRLRYVFESLAVEIIKENGGLTQEQKSKLTEVYEHLSSEQQNVSEDFHQRYYWDNCFHYTIVESSQNKRLVRMFQQMQLQITRVRWLTILSPRHNQANLEHKKIYEALVAGDDSLALKLVRAHLKKSEENFVRILNSPEYRIVHVGTSILNID